MIFQNSNESLNPAYAWSILYEPLRFKLPIWYEQRAAKIEQTFSSSRIMPEHQFFSIAICVWWGRDKPLKGFARGIDIINPQVLAGGWTLAARRILLVRFSKSSTYWWTLQRELGLGLSFHLTQSRNCSPTLVDKVIVCANGKKLSNQAGLRVILIGQRRVYAKKNWCMAHSSAVLKPPKKQLDRTINEA